MFCIRVLCVFFFFFFNDTATTEIYTLSLHDALPIYKARRIGRQVLAKYRSLGPRCRAAQARTRRKGRPAFSRSEEHTSELQSRFDLVCRLLLEKKKKTHNSEIDRNTKTSTYQRYNDR